MKPIDTFQNRLQKAINIRNIKPVELHEKTGISESLLSKYLSGNAVARQRKLTLLGDALNVNEVWLMGYDVPMDRYFENSVKKNPLDPSSAVVFIYGTIPAGIPMEMIEDIIDTEEIPLSMLKGGKQFFGLKIKGNSMHPEYLDGDTIILEKVDDVESGTDACVMVNR